MRLNLSPVTITFFLWAIILFCFDRIRHKSMTKGPNITNRNVRIVRACCCLSQVHC